MARALARVMGVRHHTQLIAWQLANELKREVYRFTATPAVRQDFKFCNQIRDSASSAPSNICEGFYRYRHTEFGRFVEIARSSIGETQNHLQDALDRNHLEAAEFGRCWELSERAMSAASKLLIYLRTHPDPMSSRKARHPNTRT